MSVPSFRIFRATGADGFSVDTQAKFVFEPALESDELFDALRCTYPEIKTHVERKRQAVLDFLVQEREADLRALDRMVSGESTSPPVRSWSNESLTNVEQTPYTTTMSFESVSPPASAQASPVAITPNFKASEPSSATNPSFHVWNPASNKPVKLHKRRCMTNQEKEEYRQRRIIGSCDSCKQKRRKCRHYEAAAANSGLKGRSSKRSRQSTSTSTPVSQESKAPTKSSSSESSPSDATQSFNTSPAFPDAFDINNMNFDFDPIVSGPLFDADFDLFTSTANEPVFFDNMLDLPFSQANTFHNFQPLDSNFTDFSGTSQVTSTSAVPAPAPIPHVPIVPSVSRNGPISDWLNAPMESFVDFDGSQDASSGVLDTKNRTQQDRSISGGTNASFVAPEASRIRGNASSSSSPGPLVQSQQSSGMTPEPSRHKRIVAPPEVMQNRGTSDGVVSLQDMNATTMSASICDHPLNQAARRTAAVSRDDNGSLQTPRTPSGILQVSSLAELNAKRAQGAQRRPTRVEKAPTEDVEADMPHRDLDGQSSLSRKTRQRALATRNDAIRSLNNGLRTRRRPGEEEKEQTTMKNISFSGKSTDIVSGAIRGELSDLLLITSPLRTRQRSVQMTRSFTTDKAQADAQIGSGLLISMASLSALPGTLTCVTKTGQSTSNTDRTIRSLLTTEASCPIALQTIRADRCCQSSEGSLSAGPDRQQLTAGASALLHYVLPWYCTYISNLSKTAQTLLGIASTVSKRRTPDVPSTIWGVPRSSILTVRVGA